jgi:hypothetical protein
MTDTGRLLRTALGSPKGPEPQSRLRAAACHRYRGPSHSFVSLTRNPALAENAPKRFEPTIKGENDVII